MGALGRLALAPVICSALPDEVLEQVALVLGEEQDLGLLR